MFLKSPLWHLGKERQLEGLGKEMKVSKRDLMGAVGLLLKKDLKRLLEKKIVEKFSLALEMPFQDNQSWKKQKQDVTCDWAYVTQVQRREVRRRKI